MSIRNQILLPIILVVLLLVGVAAGVSIKQFNGYVNETGLQATESSLKGLAGEIERRKQDALTTGSLLASYPGFAAAVSANDTAAVLKLMTPLVKEAKFDFMTVTNANGIVVARVHEPNKSGDSVTNQANVVSALKGTAAAFVEPGTVVKLSARAGIPIKNAAGTVVGVASVGYNLDQMELVDRVKKMFGADFTVFLGDLRISTTIEQNGKRAVGTQLDPAIAKIVLSDGKEFHGKATILGQPYITGYMPLVGPSGKPIGILFAGQSVKAAEEAISRTQMLIGGISLILLVISLFVMFYVVRRITRPLGIAVDDLAQLGAGNFTATVPPELLGRKDEIGKLAAAINALTQSVRGLLKQIAQSSDQVASSAEELTASAQQSAEAANNVAQSIQQVAMGSEKQVGAVNETSAIVEEVAATAGEMATLSQQTATAAQEGKSSIDRAVTQMGEVSSGSKQAQVAAEGLKASSAQIGEIVNLISTIAGQTNLLALNAAIEAARAGEQGRGFAVVAEEVRKLAEQSEQAAHQIKELVGKNHGSIDNVVGAIDVAIRDISQGVELVNVAGNNFAAINSQINQVTEQVAVIAKAVNEAATGSQRIVSSIREVENLSRDAAAESQNVSAATEQQSASMQEIAASSQALAKLAEDLQRAVAKFKI